MSKKFVCLECGCHRVEGELMALVELKINEVGDREIIYMEFNFDGDGLNCSECGSDNVAEIGKRSVY